MGWPRPKTELRTVDVGAFTVTGGAVVVTDPGYLGKSYAGSMSHLLPAPDGEWRAEAVVDARTGHTLEIGARGPGFEECEPWAVAPFEVDVDSGQVGVFAVPVCQGGQEELYQACCRVTETGAGLVEGGCVSDTGGDDGYPVWLRRDQAGRVCGVRVRFRWHPER
jgi:hypothetical protein